MSEASTRHVVTSSEQPPAEERNVEKALVSAVVAGAKHDWRAAAWLLARKYPRRWGRPS
jgi:hypothetical protein